MTVPHYTVPLIGYSDRFSVEPGGAIAFKVHSEVETTATADLVRIRCADPNPNGPGLKLNELAEVYSKQVPVGPQVTECGSYVRCSGPIGPEPAFTMAATIRPSSVVEREMAVLSYEAQGVNVALGVSSAGALLSVGSDLELARYEVGHPIRARHWCRVWAAVDLRAGTIEIGQACVRCDPPCECTESRSHRVSPVAAMPVGGEVYIGRLPWPDAYFNGKIEHPRILRGCVANPGAAAAPVADAGTVIAAWDFSVGISTRAVSDISGNGFDGVVVNSPQRAMTGSDWTGDHREWRTAPNEYGAIHFHDDDLEDCGWPTTVSLDVPDDLPSGVYGMRFRAGHDEDTIPFFLRRGADASQDGRVAVLIPTFTYQAYANSVLRGLYDDRFRARVAEWGGYPWHPQVVKEYGWSTYDRHSDGTGIAFSTRARPILTMRPGFISIHEEGMGSGVRHFVADTHLIDWLGELGIPHDVVTDHDLHAEGAKALAGYTVVLTGSHPEYHSDDSLQALYDYRRQGGSLVYLGANGFYWRVGTSDEFPDLIEVRRAGPSMRTWAPDPGEDCHALDGNPGGLWRHAGKPPQRLVGTGFSSQGYAFEGSYYRRTAASYDPDVAWVFDGVDDEVLGDFGLLGGGAAGFELDRVDLDLGSPADVVVVARSEGHSSAFHPVPEETLGISTSLDGGDAMEHVTAHMAILGTPSTGQVFAASSITFCGSLSHADYRNNISRVLFNVVNRFMGDIYEWPFE